MPTYDILNTETNEVEEVIMTISGKEKYLKDNPKVVKACKGLYHIQVDLGDTTDGWELDLTKATAIIKKKKKYKKNLMIIIRNKV